MTTFNARDKGNFTLPEGQVLKVNGSAGSAGIVRRVDPVYGGLNYLEQWPISDITPSTMGPYSGTQNFSINCTSGSIDVSTNDGSLNVVRMIAQSAVPVIFPPPRTIAANGTVTLDSALPSVYANAWVWLPAGAVVGGAAGLYWTTFTSTTVGSVRNVFADPTMPFVPYVPSGQTSAAVGSGSSTSTPTATELNAINVVIPGGSMGPNGCLRLWSIWTMAPTAGVKSHLHRLSGTAVSSLSFGNTGVWSDMRVVRNRGSQSSQVVLPNNSAPAFATAASGNCLTLSIDTASNINHTISIAVPASTDFIILEGFNTEVIPS